MIIDTDVIIDFLRRRQEALPQIAVRYACHITAISLFELQMTAIRSEQQAGRLGEILRVVSVVPFDVEAARHAAAIGRELHSSGEPIGLPDTLIAGICRSRNLPLITRNARHYERVTGIRLVSPDDLV